MKARLALAAIFVLATQSAEALTIAFEAPASPLPYAESGYAFTQTVGAQAKILTLSGGSGAMSLGVDPYPNAGDTVVVFKTGGGTFAFTAFDLFGPDSADSYDVLNVFGYLHGEVTQALLGVAPSGAGGYAFETGFSAAVDQISFVLASVQIEATWIDNLVFEDAPAPSAVPLPAGLPLLFAGLAGLTAVRRFGHRA